MLDDFEAALDSREFVTHISPGKLIILRDRVLSHRQMGIQAFTFQEFVNTLSGKRTLSFKCAMHSKDRQVRIFFYKLSCFTLAIKYTSVYETLKKSR